MNTRRQAWTPRCTARSATGSEAETVAFSRNASIGRVTLGDWRLRAWLIREPGRAAIYRIGAASAVSSVGSAATNVAFGFFLYDRTGSAVWLSVWFFLSFGITGLLTPVFGWIADRSDRRLIVIGSNLAAGVCSLSLIVAHEPVALIGIAFIAAIVGGAGSPAFRAATPNLAGTESLEWANGTVNVGFHVGNLIGPIIGGAVYVAGGRAIVFAFDALTYVIAALMVASLRMPFRALEDAPTEGPSQEEKAGVLRGFRIVFADPILRPLIFIWALGYFSVDIVLVGELPLTRALGAGALGFGIVEAAWGAGSIVGSLAGTRLRRDQDALGILIGVVGIAIANGLIVVSPWFTALVVLSGVVAVASGVEDVAGYSLIQRKSVDDVRGRVLSTFSALGLVANAIAFAIAGSIVEAFGPRAVFAVGGVASALCLAFLKPIYRGARDPDRRLAVG
jgi:MFS family permease